MIDFLKTFFSKKHLLNNIQLKIVSFIAAIIVWIVVVNITDPMGTQPYKNVTVKLINTDLITDNGKTYEILNNTNLISSVTIRASRTTIRELGDSNDAIVAVADFSKLSADGTYVPIDISTSKYNEKIDRIRPSSDKLAVNIENKKSIQIPIQTTTSGNIESGYIVGSVTPSQNQVKISGPESVIDRIKTAVVDVQITGFTEDIATQTEVVLYDADGNIIPKKNLSMNAESVNVVAEILATKKVPVHYSTMGVPAEGYSLTGEIECSPETVVIAGPSAMINNVSAVTIPASELNVTGQTETLQTLIELSEFLPENIRFADSTYNGKASIKIYIEAHVEDNFVVDPHEISVNGVPEGLKYEIISDDIYEIFLTGLAQNLEKVVVENLNCHVDFEKYIEDNDIKEIEEGEYTLPLVFDVPDGLKISGETEITLRLFE